MKIECFFAEGCGSKEQLRKNIHKALLEEEWKQRFPFGKGPHSCHEHTLMAGKNNSVLRFFLGRVP